MSSNFWSKLDIKLLLSLFVSVFLNCPWRRNLDPSFQHYTVHLSKTRPDSDLFDSDGDYWKGGEEEVNSSLSSFPLSTATYHLLGREEWERVSWKILMEDFCISKHMQLVGKIDCGLVGEVNTVKLWMNLATEFRPHVNKPPIRFYLM